MKSDGAFGCSDEVRKDEEIKRFSVDPVTYMFYEGYCVRRKAKRVFLRRYCSQLAVVMTPGDSQNGCLQNGNEAGF